MSRAPHIDRWLIAISGFTERLGDPNGTLSLWGKLRSLAGPHASVQLLRWCDDWSQIAEWIWRCRRDEAPPQIAVFAYSWGAGWGAMRLARELAERGLAIEQMVLSDPVYRGPGVLGYAFRWRSLIGSHWPVLGALAPTIRVPANVRRVTWFRQEVSIPSGHALLADDAAQTEIEPARLAWRNHTKMDDLLAFHNASLAAAKRGTGS